MARLALLPDAPSPNALGAFYMMASMACFIANDAVMKTFAGTMAWYEALAVRGFMGVALSVGLCLAIDGPRPPRTMLAHLRDVPTLVRIACELGATAFFLLALFNMPLAGATAIIQTLPLLLTVGGALFFGEDVGWRRWAAALVGFAGVLLIVRPGTGTFQPAALYALLAAFFMAGRDLFTKAVPAGIPSTYVSLYTTIAVWAMALALSAPGGFPALDALILFKLLCAAALIAVGFLFAILTVRTGEISFVAPFRYSILIWSLLLGFLLFDEVPSELTLIGAGIVVAAGLYTFSRERLVARNESMASASAPTSADSQSRKI